MFVTVVPKFYMLNIGIFIFLFIKVRYAYKYNIQHKKKELDNKSFGWNIGIISTGF